MAATTYNFTIEQGSVFEKTFVYKDANGNIINTTNYCARITIQSLDGAAFKKTYTTDVANSEYSFTVDGNNGKFVLRLSATETNNYNFSNATYDFDIKLPNEIYAGAGSNIIRLLKGNITIDPRNVTNPDDFACSILPDPCVVCPS